MAVSKRLRFEILRRDNHQCRYCGATGDDGPLTIDHVKPVALGGSDDPSNLVAACKDCNAGKTSMPADAAIVADVSADALQWAAAMKQVAEMRAAELDNQFALLDWFVSEWDCFTNWRGDTFDADDAPASIPQFMKAGLTKQEIKELIAVAMKGPAKDKWRYFCGCCWKRIRENQELAAEIVGGGLPFAAKLTTVWTVEQIEARVARAESCAARWLHQTSIDSFYCNHMEDGPGDCGDPVCRVERAEALGWMSDQNMLKGMRGDEVVEAAEALLDD